MQWTRQQQDAALAQGWGVFEVWDGRVLYEILRDDNSAIFDSHAAARAFVVTRAMTDPLCRAACMLVFHHQPGPKR